jgi:hypothetical protein
MHRRMVSKGKWYLRYVGELPLPRVVLATGERPAAVEVHKLVTKIPSPDQVAAKGYYDPAKLKVTDELVETHACPLAGDIPPFMKVRRGIPLSAEEQAQLDADAEREAKSAESKRRSWATRRDWGGAGPLTPTPTLNSVTPPAAARDARDGRDGRDARPTGPVDDEPALKAGEDGE